VADLICPDCGANRTYDGKKFTVLGLEQHRRAKHVRYKNRPELPSPRSVEVFGREEEVQLEKQEKELSKDRTPVCFCPVCGTNLKAVEDAVNR
jgi:rubredoxin